MHKAVLLSLVVLLAFVHSARAEVRVVETEYTYVLGESDTRSAARKACFAEAKRLALEQAGTFTQSVTAVENMTLTSDEIRTFAAAFVEAELVDERFHVTGDTFAVTCKVRARVDPKQAAEELARMAAKQREQDRLSRLNKRVEALEKRNHSGRTKSSEPSGNGRYPVVDPPQSRAERKQEIMRKRKEMYAYVRDYIERGMLPSEVYELVGKPLATRVNRNMTVQYQCDNYGDIWVVYRDGVVACTRNRLQYRQRYGGSCHCAGSLMEVFTQ